MKSFIKIIRDGGSTNQADTAMFFTTNSLGRSDLSWSHVHYFPYNSTTLGESYIEIFPAGTEIMIECSGDDGNSAGNITLAIAEAYLDALGNCAWNQLYCIDTKLACNHQDYQKPFTYILLNDSGIKIYSSTGSKDDYKEYPPVVTITVNKDILVTVLDIIDYNLRACDSINNLFETDKNAIVTKETLDFLQTLSTDGNGKDPMMVIGTNITEEKQCLKYEDLIISNPVHYIRTEIKAGNTISFKYPTLNRPINKVELYVTITSDWNGNDLSINGIPLVPYQIEWEGTIYSGTTNILNSSLKGESIKITKLTSDCNGEFTIQVSKLNVKWKSKTSGLLYTDTGAPQTARFDIYIDVYY